jgi:hypothetical protein
MTRIQPYRQNLGYRATNNQTYNLCTTEEVRKYLNLSFTDDDNFIYQLILSASSFIEDYCNQIFSESQTKEYIIDWYEVPADGIFWIPFKFAAKGVDVTQLFISFYKDDGATQIAEVPTFIKMDDLVGFKFESMPDTLNESVVKISCTIQPDNEANGQVLHSAMILAGHFYNNRDIVVTGASVSAELPFHIKALLDNNKIKLF